jgi:hypothetical protein
LKLKEWEEEEECEGQQDYNMEPFSSESFHYIEA